MNFLIFFLVSFSVLGLGCYYIGWRLITSSHLAAPWNYVAWTALILLFLIAPGNMIMMRSGLEKLSHDLAWLSFVGLGLLSFLFTFVLFKDALWLLGIAGVKIYSLFRASSHDASKREFLAQSINFGIVVGATSLTAYGVFEARRRPAVREMDIALPNLPEAFNGFRMVQITDIHAGLTVERDFVERVVTMVNELNPDLVAFTGDMVDGSVRELRHHVAPFQDLSAKHGVFFVTGNHEYYSGVAPWLEEASRLGMQVLINEFRIIERGSSKIVIGGVTDPTGAGYAPSHVSDPVRSLQGCGEATAKILLAHQPKSVFAAAEAGYDVMLCGHTHGGQFFPWNLLAAAGQPYLKGLHRHDRTWVYVSQGTGYWGPPVRLMTRSEISVIRLVNG